MRGVFAVGCEDGAVLVLCSVNKSKKKLLEVRERECVLCLLECVYVHELVAIY